MPTYYIELVTTAHPDDGMTEVAFEDELDELMAAFEDVEGVADVDLGWTASTGALHLCMYVAAENRVDAMQAANVATRTAIHSIGGATPGWEADFSDDSFSAFIKPASLTVC